MLYDAEIKARIPSAWEKAIKQRAAQEGLNDSDIIRRAIRIFLGAKAAIPRKTK